MTPDPADTIARTAWAEARGCGTAGMARVVSVILNRAAHPRWWGATPVEVCLKPWQFSCWLVNDPNRAKLLAVTGADPQFSVALDLAHRALAGELPDETGGADSYFALSMKARPAWVNGAVHTLDDGWHSFWITRGAAHAPQAYEPRPMLANQPEPARPAGNKE